MRSTARIAAGLVLLVLAPSASAATPSSFARWTTRWASVSSKAINAALDPCEQHFVENGAKAGACTVRNVKIVYRQMVPLFSRGIADVARGQTPACRAAIHVYWLASRTEQKANMAYLNGHARVTVTQMNADLSGEPFRTLVVSTANARSQAVRICG